MDLNIILYMYGIFYIIYKKIGGFLMGFFLILYPKNLYLTK
ncbi:hypothetical protein Cst_c25440 [Thermoclostridium stercorarium subsp. stercorarium DSM 8532]|uniref:Uncharacterized protein n=1 Tax=Thermoclostridium stercorarium (strain ATCC 35414 / DSM 8532 / NCIMB 11754) TaxID=1121335 RepID=L7VSZ2_THES1|nr:hypothetical protein Cst_c25440 [Thermoclostridium stercorarium subsp. stercorarium DSM 8532]